MQKEKFSKHQSLFKLTKTVQKIIQPLGNNNNKIYKQPDNNKAEKFIFNEYTGTCVFTSSV